MQNTVAIASNKRPEGWVLINEWDFDSSQHTLYVPGRTAEEIQPEQSEEASALPVASPEEVVIDLMARRPGRPRKKE